MLHHLINLIILGRFLQAAGQIHSGHFGGKDAEGHDSELPVELRDDLSHGLGSASRSRDDVLGSLSAIMPQLSGGAIHSLLGDNDGVDSGHKSLHDAKVVMDDLGQGGQTVGGAGGITDNLEGVVILLVAQAHHKHGGISRRHRDDDSLGATLQVSPSLLHGSEDPSGLHHEHHPHLMLAGSRSWKMVMAFPLMMSFPFSALTVPWNLPWVESYWNM